RRRRPPALHPVRARCRRSPPSPGIPSSTASLPAPSMIPVHRRPVSVMPYCRGICGAHAFQVRLRGVSSSKTFLTKMPAVQLPPRPPRLSDASVIQVDGIHEYSDSALSDLKRLAYEVFTVAYSSWSENTGRRYCRPTLNEYLEAPGSVSPDRSRNGASLVLSFARSAG